MEHSPEVFGTVEMLYVIMEVNPKANNVPVKTFVGACVRARACASPRAFLAHAGKSACFPPFPLPPASLPPPSCPIRPSPQPPCPSPSPPKNNNQQTRARR